MCAQSIAGLRASSLPAGASLGDRLAKAHDAIVALRPAIDAALRLPLAQRDAALVARYGEVSLDYVKAISGAADAVEQATTLFDPEIDPLDLAQSGGYGRALLQQPGHLADGRRRGVQAALAPAGYRRRRRGQRPGRLGLGT